MKGALVMDTDNNMRLSPPWWTLYRKILETIGKDPFVYVKEMYQEGENYYIDILVMGCSKARALAAILKPIYNMGNLNVYVRVFCIFGEKIDGELCVDADPVNVVIKTVKTALKSNKYYKGVIDTRSKLPPPVAKIIGQVVLVIKKEVVQFWNDDLSDFYGNFNAVAAFVFNDVLITNYPGDVKLSTTTESVPNIDNDDKNNESNLQQPPNDEQ